MPTTPQLPSTSSLVDFLSTQKKDSSFGARKKIYSDLGFDKRLGEYQGSANQNLSILKQLQNESKSSEIPPANELLSGIDVSRNETPTSNFKLGANPKILDLLKTPGGQTKAPFYPTPTGEKPSSMTTSSALSTLGVNPPITETPTASSITSQTVTPPVSNQPEVDKSLLESVNKPDPNEQDLLNQFLDSQEGKNLLSDAERKGLTEGAKTKAAKQVLETKYASDKTSLEQKLAANGLAFSGIRGTQVKALADSLAASLLGEDRALASKLLDSDAKLRDDIIQGVADLAKEAQNGRKEAIQQLNAIGYAVVGNKLVPTLSFQSGQRAEEAALRAEKSLSLSERRLQLAEEAATRAERGNKLTLSEVTTRGLPASLVGASEQDVADSFYSPTAPTWFQEKFSNENPNFKPPYSQYEKQLISKAWDSERKAYIIGTTESTNRAKATSYFSSAYGEAITPEQMKTLVDRVELYINQGKSYADAVQKVIDEAS